MKSHFSPNSKVALACAVAGASTMIMNGNCSAGGLVAADYATNPIYADGWSAGQNGGYGFGPWSFDGTDTTPPTGPYQGISTTSPLGTAWTLLTYDPHSGIADAGRAITEPGGLQPGQTLELVLDNPAGNFFYRGWDILFLNGTDNNPGGDNTAALRAQYFDYFTTDWSVVDGSGGPLIPLDINTTASAGVKVDLTLTSTNSYLLTMTPLSAPSNVYSQTGLLTTNLPINYVNFRLYWGPSTGLTDTGTNYEISSMTIQGLNLNLQLAGRNTVLSWPTNAPGFNLVSSTNLGPGTIWSTNNLPEPVVINGQNVVTNPIAGAQQYFRLQE
jgi:hypothetical protein